MALNDQKICIQIAKKPGCGAVHLADVLDCELTEISTALRSLVDVGDVVRAPGFATNGQPAQLYSLSETFLKSKEGKIVIAHLESQARAPAAPAPSPQPAAAPIPAAPAPAPSTVIETPPPAPTPAPKAEPLPLTKNAPAENSDTASGASRTEIAIAYIVEHGSVIEADLRKAMGLRAGQYPAAWLVTAMKHGKVRKVGKTWLAVRHEEPAAPPKDPQPIESVKLADAPPLAAEHKVGVPVFLNASAGDVELLPTPPKALLDRPGVVGDDVVRVDLADMITSIAAQPTFRVGLWSDGVLELRRHGETIAELSPAEQEIISHHFHQKQTA